MLALVAVDKEYDLRPILYNVTLALTEGTRYVLTAANGSGKTTLLQIMAGLARPTRGQVLWGDGPPTAKTRSAIGTVLQDTFLYGDLTAEENLVFYARLFGCRDYRALVDAWLKRLSLEDDRDLKVRQLSKGQKQRLSLARAMLHRPKLLLLDEPFDGLDSTVAQWFGNVLDDALTEGVTQFMVTHQPWTIRQRDVHLTLQHGRLVEVQ